MDPKPAMQPAYKSYLSQKKKKQEEIIDSMKVLLMTNLFSHVFFFFAFISDLIAHILKCRLFESGGSSLNASTQEA
jgi:hypothetical protein